VAVKKHDFETVKILVEAGADVNEQVTNWRHDIREHDKTPLPSLEEAVYARSEEMIRYLVKHGARVPREFITDKYTPEEYKPFKSLVAELGAVKGEAPL
jgi:ankyrin repeat protein